jgi:hypothetical protein
MRGTPDHASTSSDTRTRPHRRRRPGWPTIALTVCGVLLTGACSPADRSPATAQVAAPAAAAVTGTAASSTFTVAAVGDISAASIGAQARTAALAASWNPAYVLALGDLQYPSGSLADFRRYYAPTWGKLDARTRPVPGNHEYRTSSAAGYFSYFGDRATPDGRSYYSFDRGGWHIVALNSENSHSARSTQLKWLKADLKANKRRCVLAYWHRPRFNSGAEHGSNRGMTPFWDALYARKADVVLNGHEHVYERFGRQSPSGRGTQSGIREFVVGTGGAEHYTFGNRMKNSQVRIAGVDGVLRLSLASSSYRWQFVGVDGRVRDQGETACH